MMMGNCLKLKSLLLSVVGWHDVVEYDDSAIPIT